MLVVENEWEGWRDLGDYVAYIDNAPGGEGQRIKDVLELEVADLRRGQGTD